MNTMQIEKRTVRRGVRSNDSLEELYDLIQVGIDDFEDGRVLSETEVIANMEKALL